MRILIIEDCEFMAEAMKLALSEQGHSVDWIIGVRNFAPFTGINAEKQDVAADPSQYDIALCDGELFGDNEGPAIVEALVANNVPCLGMSSTRELNNKMVENGAGAGFLKVCLFAAIVEQTVNIMEAARQPSQQVIQQVTQFEQRIREDKELRRKLDERVAKFMPH